MKTPAGSLYLCYQSLLEPLTQTQVVAYLEGLAQAGYRVVLLTFEPRSLSRDETRQWRKRLASQGIQWHWRRYHRRPTLPATLWDVLVGIGTGFWLIRRYRLGLVHARAHVPGVMGWALKRMLAVNLLFDVRGWMAEEYVDAGRWTEGGFLFRLSKKGERATVRAADGVVVLTHAAEKVMRQWYPRELADKPIEVIPCCVDTQDVPRGSADARPATPTLLYAGKLGGWYASREMIEFAATAREQVPGTVLRVFTQSDSSELRQVAAQANLNGQLMISRVEPRQVMEELVKAIAGLCFYQRRLSAAACSPTKVAEYLAAGLPVVATAGIGDTDDVLLGRVASRGTSDARPVGVVLREMDEAGYSQAVKELKQLWNDPATPERCRAIAEESFDLRRVGWVRYGRLYEALLSRSERRQSRWRRLVRTVLLLGLIVAAVLYYHRVDNRLSAEDRQYIERFMESSAAPTAPRDYEEQLALISSVQKAVIDHTPVLSGIAMDRPREPKDVYLAGRGKCYDRSRAIEKALRFYGFETRHVAIYSTKKTGSAAQALLASGGPSHAATEVRTSRGWLIVDSILPWISLDRRRNPVSMATLQAAGAEAISWEDDVVLHDELIMYVYREPFTYVYGLYSRHGRFFPPYNFIPDVNYPELGQNLLP
jgi:glycosyltransferase involved in cell wall biosynthesis